MGASLVTPVRRTIGNAVRTRVAGPDADAAHARIWDTTGERWFSPADPIWRVHLDASTFVGGITALLLQSLHPLAMAGVAGHSGFRGDPWGRLQRTSAYIATTTFGTIEQAEEMINVVRAVHRRVNGTTPDGRHYSASDPHLLRWVHVAETWSFLTAHRSYGESQLSAAEADHYVSQAAHAAGLLGANNLPHSVAELNQALCAYRPELAGGPAARDVCEFLLREPPLPAPARSGYQLLARGAVALLPPWAMAELNLTGPRLAHASGTVGVRAVRWSLAAVG